MKTLLFVEDDPVLGSVYRHQFNDAGFNTIWVKDGEEALDVLRDTKPDIVVLDVILPKVPGSDVLKFIRAHELLESTPVLVLTGVFQQAAIDDVKLLRPTRVLPKSSFVPREVAELAQNLVGMKQPGRQAPDAPPAQNPEDAAIRKKIGELLEKCRGLIVDANKQRSPEVRAGKLRSLCGYVHNLGGAAAAKGLKGHAYFCEAVEALAEDLAEDSEKMTDSNLRTVTQAVDFLFESFKISKPVEIPTDPGLKILVVDDDPVSRRAICVSLGRIQQDCVDVDNAGAALSAAGNTQFDLIFLDVDMPDMNGHDLCTELRKTEMNKSVPVIFVTGLTDLQNRAQSMLSGGTDFIGKPFEFMELAVKALIHLLRNRLR